MSASLLLVAKCSTSDWLSKSGAYIRRWTRVCVCVFLKFSGFCPGRYPGSTHGTRQERALESINTRRQASSILVLSSPTKPYCYSLMHVCPSLCVDMLIMVANNESRGLCRHRYRSRTHPVSTPCLQPLQTRSPKL